MLIASWKNDDKGAFGMTRSLHANQKLPWIKPGALSLSADPA